MFRHRTDPGALLAGLYFATVAGIFMATGFSGEIIVPWLTLGPAMLMGYGLVMLVRVLSRSRRRY